ncbi:SdrD B-like domain-containing protein, partial [Spirosoma sp. 48-14]
MPISTTKALSRLFLFLAVCLASSLPGLGQTITGTVFRDFNSDGAYTSTPLSGTYAYGEPGVGGVTIKAYNASGVVTASTTSSTLTASLGSYTLNVANTNAYRVEFTGFVGPDYEGFHGSGNATSIQFVNGGATNVNFGLNYPADYCQSTSPQLITSCFVATDAANAIASVKARPATVSVSYTVVETSKVVTDYATVGEVGAVWGIAYDNTPASNRLFSASFTKRHVGFATGGPNAIYVTNVTSATSGNTTEFFNFTTVGSSAVTSTTEAHGTDLPTSTSLASHDNAAFDAVGKTSLGGMDLSDDNKSLFVVNLKNRNLYRISTADKSYTSIAIPNPGCPTTGTAVNGSYRPFAVKYYRDKVYVGVVCTREDLGSTTVTYGSTAGLSATVYAIDPTALSSFTTVLSFPLTYQKAPTNADKTGQSRAEYWRPWTSVFQTDRNDGVLSYPQAWLTDIEFEPATGDMILGIRDRYGDQMGYQNYLPFTTSTTLYSAITPGEILRARKCNVTDVQWSIESGGSLCGSTTSLAQSSTAGPGDGKYYWGDEVQNAANHGLSSQGGIAQLPGSAKVAMTAVDPLDIFNTGGIKRLINATGAKDGNATYISNTTNVAAGAELYTSDALGYGKANGLGGLAVLCNLAPTQIGNRVWLDSNNNGIQDPGETPLSGVRVTLSGPGLASPVSVTTNASGEYYFSNASGTNVLGSAYSLTGLTSGSSYTLTFPTSVSTASLSTKPNSATGTNTDNIDTDPNASGLVTFTLGQAGVNDFSFDAGYAPCTPPSLTLTAIPNAICQGQTVALLTTVSPANNYTYVVSGPVGVSLTGANTATAIATNLPTGVNNFTVTVYSSPVCLVTSTASVTVSTTPLINLTPSASTICAGQSVELDVAGIPLGGLLSFSELGPLGNVINTFTSNVVSPTVTTTYLATVVVPIVGSVLGSCPVTITVNPALTLPPLSLSLCVGTTIDPTNLSGLGGSLTALSGLTNILRLGNILGSGSILSAPISVSAGVNLFNVTSTTPLGCTATTPVTVTGINGPILPALSLSLCVGTTIDPANLSGLGGNLTALSGLTNVLRLGNILGSGSILSTPVSVSAGVNLFNVTSTNPLGCTSTAPIAITGVQAPLLPPLNLSLCVGTNLDLGSLVSPTGALSALSGLTNVFRLGSLVTGQILTSPVSISAGVNLFNLTSTTPLGCTSTTPISVTGVEAPILPPLNLSLCVGTNLDLGSLVSPTGALSALSGLTNVFRLGSLVTGQILTSPVSISAGVNLFNLTSTTPLGCTSTTPISVTGVEAPILPPLNLSLCV